jgi:hypothetical protein
MQLSQSPFWCELAPCDKFLGIPDKRPSLTAQVEAAIAADVRELRAIGEIKHTSEEARWIARRILNLYYADGRYSYKAERSIEPFIEAAGIDPVTLNTVDYDRFTAQVEIWKERWTQKRKRKIRKSGRPTVTLQDSIVLAGASISLEQDRSAHGLISLR